MAIQILDLDFQDGIVEPRRREKQKKGAELEDVLAFIRGG
jgi:hypothetical protein